MEKRTIVVIPSSRYVDFELRMEFGHIPPVMLPIDYTNVLTKIVRFYDSESNLLLGYHQGKEVIDYYIKQSLLPVKCVNVGHTIDLGHTIYKTLLSEESLEQTEVFIHFGDTIISNSLLEEYKYISDYIFVSKVNDPWRWTIVNKENQQLSFWDKETLSLQGCHDAVIGVIKISDPTTFLHILKEAIFDALETGHQTFYKALSNYSKLYNVNLIKIKRNDWIDAGHIDRLNDYRKNMKARSFNSVQVDHKKGIILKRSENKQKLINEILWYCNLPKTLQFCIPRIIDCSIEKDDPFVSMDYYGYPSLADIFVHGNLDIQKWRELLLDLKWLLGQFSEHHLSLSSRKVYEYKRQMYVVKVKERLSSFSLSSELKEIAEGGKVNGLEILSLKECLLSLEMVFEKVIPNNVDIFHVMHGDFCLSNILFDSRFNTFRIIDPRGSFGEIFAYGDQYYDLAKLSHSLRGYYDFLVREQFYYDREEGNITFTPYTSPVHYKLGELFDEIFINNDKDRNIIDFIESTLFLSMIPLHQDSEKRQLGMLITGLMKYSKLYNELLF